MLAGLHQVVELSVHICKQQLIVLANLELGSIVDLHLGRRKKSSRGSG